MLEEPAIVVFQARARCSGLSFGLPRRITSDRPVYLLSSSASVLLTPASFAQNQQTPPSQSPADGQVQSGKPSNPTPAAAGAKADTITVTSNALAVESLIDRKVYRADADLQHTSGTAADLLKSIPSVEVDPDGNVSLRGDPNVTILIDGKPSSQVSGASRADGLAQIPASDIDHFEVITNPSAQYKPDGSGGIINIVTRKIRKQGLSGMMQATLGNRQRSLVGVTSAYNQGRLRLSGGLNVRTDDRLRDQRELRSSIDPVTLSAIATDHTLNEHQRVHGLAAQAAADYVIDDNDIFGVSIGDTQRRAQRHFLQTDQSEDAMASPLSDSTRQSHGASWRLDGKQAVHYDHDFSRKGEKLTLNIQRTVTRERETYDYLNTFLFPIAPQSRDHLRLSLDLVTTEFSGDYVLPFGGGSRLQAGYDIQHDDNAYDNSGYTIDAATGGHLPDPNITNDFRYDQTVYAAYATYQTQLMSVDVLAGLRLEQASTSFYQITNGVGGGGDYARAYPTLHLSKDLTDTQKLTASFSERVRRPDPEELNPFTDRQDISNLRAGNPNLKPEEIQSFELGYANEAGPVTYSATGYYRVSRNGVTDITTVLSNNVFLSTKANLAQGQSTGVEFATSGRLFRGLSVTLTGNVYYNQIDTAGLTATASRSTFSGSAKTTIDYKPTNDVSFQIGANYSGRRLTPQGYVLPTWAMNFGYRRQLNDKLALVLTLSDLLDTQIQHRRIETLTLRDDYRRTSGGRVAYLGLVYTFGDAKKPKSDKFDYEQ